MPSKFLIVSIALAVAAQACCCGAILDSPQPPYTIEPPDESLDHLQERIDSIEADDTGHFSVIITEEEMTALTAQALEELEETENPPPLSQPQVYFRNNRIEAYATIHAAESTDVPGMIAFTVEVQDGEIIVTVEEINVSLLPTVESLAETITEKVNEALAEWISSNRTNYVITDIKVGDKEMTIFGKVPPGQ